MAILVDWDDNKQTCIVITFQRPWDWPEFHAAYEKMDALFKGVSHETHLVLNISDGGFPPGGALQEFRRVSEYKHVNLGKIVVVGVPFFFRGMLNVLKSVYQGRYEAPDFLFAASIEKARDLLYSNAPAEPPVQKNNTPENPK